MQEVIANMVTYMINTLMDNFIELNGVLSGDIASRFPAMYEMINKIHSLITPICETVLGVIFFVEFVKVIIRMESLNMEMLVSILAKFGIAYSAMEWGPSVLNAIYATAAEWISGLSSSAAPAELPNIQKKLSDAVEGLTWWECAGYMLYVGIAILITAFVGYSIMIMAWARVIEIIILMAMIPLPVAFSMTDGGRIIKQYLLNFAAVCLQGFMMLVVCSMFGSIVTDMIGSHANGTGLTGSMTGVVFIAVMLGTLLKKTGTWARQVFALQ